MKKIIALLLALLLTLSALPALSEGADIRMELPDEIRSFFSASSFKGYTLYPDSFTVLQNGAGGQVAFAVLSKESEHIFYGFEIKNGKWQYWLKNASLLPQIKGKYQLSNAKGSTDFHANLVYTEDALSIALLEEDLDYFRYGSLFVSTEKGQWMLVSLSTYLLNSRHYTSVRVYADHIAYYSEADLIGHAWGVVERNLRYVNFSAFPGTLEDARSILSNPPSLPSGSQLSAAEIHFTGGQKFPVYMGPGADYPRAGGGKAMVSTNDWIQVFGRENGFILIQYDITADQMRFGYITEDALPKNASVPTLELKAEEAVITQSTYLTDEPLKGQARIRSLSPGKNGVTFLSQMGDWAYVEVHEGGQKMRGFVPAYALSRKPETQHLLSSFTDGEYTAQASVEISSGVNLFALIEIKDYAWQENSASPILGYQLYANNLPIAALSSSAKTESSQGVHYAFTLSASIPLETDVLGLCPLYADGPHAGETILLRTAY